MQFPTVNWTNPAAATQQAALTQRTGFGSQTASNPTGNAVDGIENSAKTGDRDADERYDAPNDLPSHGQGSQEGELDDKTAERATQLPADDGEASQLDLLG